MKKIVKILACAFVAGLFTLVSGCSDSDDELDEIVIDDVVDGDGSIVESYISGYSKPTGVRFDLIEQTGAAHIYIDVDYLNREQSHELSVKYNDLSYYQLQSIPVVALYDGITSLSMETVDYFDEAHPAGSDISEIVYCKYVTYYEFIQSGYANPRMYSKDCPPVDYDPVGAFPHEMWLSEVNYENSKLMSDEMIIEFPVEPETPGVYSFIFHFNMPEIQLETTFEYEFQ